MSDVNYMNAYVNLVMETVHSNLNDILQLKTQTKLLNDLVLEKDQVISSLTTELETARTNQSNSDAASAEQQAEMQRLRESAATWEAEYNNMSGKVSHMDTLANQYNELQKQHLEKLEEASQITTILNEYRKKAHEYEQKIETLTLDLEAANKKVESLSKKEEKKTVATLLPKIIINKEETKSTPITQKSKTVVVEKHKETDDDF